jgi:hypothetical protein
MALQPRRPASTMSVLYDEESALKFLPHLGPIFFGPQVKVCLFQLETYHPSENLKYGFHCV